ncbi:MAG TPA: hypothetical protein VF188_09000 [Longimicrobiales bacterium]
MADEEPLGAPDTSYKLDPSIRARLEVAFDADALETILASYPNPAQRDKALEEFLELADRSAQGEIVITGFSTIGERPEVNEAAARIMRRMQAENQGCPVNAS